MKIIIIAFNRVAAEQLKMQLLKNYPEVKADVMVLAETNWQQKLDYDRIKPHRLSSDLEAMYGDLVGQLMLLRGGVIFDLRSVDGELPQNGSELFVTVARNSSLERSAALIDPSQSTSRLSGLFTDKNCARCPNVSDSLEGIINWFDNWFDNIDNLIAA